MLAFVVCNNVLRFALKPAFLLQQLCQITLSKILCYPPVIAGGGSNGEGGDWAVLPS